MIIHLGIKDPLGQTPAQSHQEILTLKHLLRIIPLQQGVKNLIGDT